MNIRTIATLAVALLLGLIATMLVRSYISSAKTPAAKGAAVAVAGATPVVVAAGPIVRGAPLQPNLLKIAFYPADAVPAGAFRTVAEVNGAARRALRAMGANEPILLSQISGPGGKAGMSHTLDDGMRAIAVRSNDVVGVGGFALPGDRVDVLVTRQVGAADSVNTVTQILAENVRVLAVDQAEDADKPVVAKAVTVEVTPDQAQSISLAQAVGTVTLSLRSPADAAVQGRRATTVADLGFGGRPARSAAPAPRAQVRLLPTTSANQVRVTRGVETSGYAVAQY